MSTNFPHDKIVNGGTVMKLTHATPEIYNPHVSNEVKCKIVEQLCCALAAHRGVTISYLRDDLKNKLNVDFKDLKDNPVGMFLLYEYIYSLRPSVCNRINIILYH